MKHTKEKLIEIFQTTASGLLPFHQWTTEQLAGYYFAGDVHWWDVEGEQEWHHAARRLMRQVEEEEENGQ